MRFHGLRRGIRWQTDDLEAAAVKARRSERLTP